MRTEPIDRRVLPVEWTEIPTNLARDYRDQAPLTPPCPARPPAGAPNVLLVLLDDMGFGSSSAFGGPCRMPTADRLAREGLRYTRFHTTALCAPTRAALLSGRNHHSVGMGAIPELAGAAPGYDAMRPRSMAPLARILQANGYATGAFGKMHQTPSYETSEIGPFDRWPTGEGFDRFYGFLGAETNQFVPNLIDGTTRISPPKTPEEGYHLSEDLADQVIGWIDSLVTFEPDRPWFAYLSYGAVHDPLQVPPGWRERYEGEFADGWNAARDTILARQKAFGLVPDDAVLAAWGDGVPLWDDLTATERLVAERLMETYAAMAEHADAQTGRVVDAVERLGQLENTLVIYVLGDNGASAEGGLYGTLNQVLHINHLTDDAEHIAAHIDDIGTPRAYAHYPAGWALAMNTPYRFAKQVASHYGGTRNGLVVHWPAGIRDVGGVRHQWHHCIDIAPTVLEAAGLPHPDVVDGAQQDPMEGTSMLYSFDDAGAAGRHRVQYFEIFGNRGVYVDGWTAVTAHKIPWRRGAQLSPFDQDVWELYDTESDWTQAADLAGSDPGRLAQLQRVFDEECEKYHVYPLDDRLNERFVPSIAGRRTLLGERERVSFTRLVGPMPEDVAPDVKNVSFHAIVRVGVPHDGANGVLVAQGGRFGGWSFYVHEGRLAYCYNYADLERTYVRAQSALPAGEHTVELDFDYAGGGLGLGATVRLLSDGRQVAIGSLERTLKFSFSIDETMDIGVDRGTPVTDDYPQGGANAFTGDIDTVQFVLGRRAARPSDAATRQSHLASH